MIWYRNIENKKPKPQIRNFVVEEKDKKRLIFSASLIPKTIKTVLDVGMKTGYFCSLVKERGFTVYGVDVEPRISCIEGKLPFCFGDAARLPFKDKSIDCVTCFELLEHLDSATLDRTVAELNRVARKLILVSVPYKECPILNINHLQNFNENRLESFFGDVFYVYYGSKVAGWSKPKNWNTFDKAINRLLELARISIKRQNIPRIIFGIKECEPNIWPGEIR